jgi:hypothetical protein
MRKTKETTYAIYAVIWSNIRKYQYLNHITDEQLAEILEVCTRTLYTYDSEPNKVTLEKVQLFLDNLNIGIESLIIV